MRITYTYHASEQINERKLEKIWVEETIKYPDFIQRENDKYYAIKKLNGITLKVVFVKQRHINVITVYFLK